MRLSDPVDGWLVPLQPVLAGLISADWAMRRFAADLVALLDEALPPGEETGSAASRLLGIRRRLANLGHTDVAEGGVAETLRDRLGQALRQFVCGFHDLDLRDATGAGHGRMILRHAQPAVSESWAARLRGGDMVGIAATERHGGSRLREITTTARPRPGGGWWVSGEKCWVSRLEEAAGFVVFFRNPSGAISAALVPSDAQGLHRWPVPPAGLGGWSWGALELVDVAIAPEDLVGEDGGGLDVFHEHFAHYRPLVTITALGAAASVHAAVAATLRARITMGIVPRLRDTTLVAMGRTYAELNAALLAAFAAAGLGDRDPSTVDLWARSTKAYGVDVAFRASCELPLLVGALGFAADSPLIKVRNDLAGLLYADGIHDSLYRSAGRTLIAMPQVGDLLVATPGDGPEEAELRSVRRSPGTPTGPQHVRPGRRRRDGRGGATAAPAP